jgi:hypothetical protein
MQNKSKKPSGRLENRPSGRYFAREMKRTDTLLRDTLLDAAEAVVARQGVANLTFDAVAAEAGMSKGGCCIIFGVRTGSSKGWLCARRKTGARTGWERTRAHRKGRGGWREGC